MLEAGNKLMHCKMISVEGGAEEIAPPPRRNCFEEAYCLAGGDGRSCVHLPIPLNKCIVKEYYFPWKCENEKHTYEKYSRPVPLNARLMF
jgi:hypothetical protein